LLAGRRQEAIKRRAAGETLAEIAKSYAVALSREAQAREGESEGLTSRHQHDQPAALEDVSHE